MPKHQISYAHLEGKEKQEKAITDIREYFGNNTAFDSVVAKIKTIEPSKKATKSLVFQFDMFSGISGYPVVALLSDTWGVSEDQIYTWLEKEEDKDGN